VGVKPAITGCVSLAIDPACSMAEAVSSSSLVLLQAAAQGSYEPATMKGERALRSHAGDAVHAWVPRCRTASSLSDDDDDDDDDA
jgi:hypothetical protein